MIPPGKIRYLLQILAVIFISYFLIAFFIGEHVYTDNKIKSDALIVLGAKAKLGNIDSPCLSSRIRHAIDLYKQGYASKIVVSGGNDEANTMRRIAQENGVPTADILPETDSTSTYENFLYSKRLMQKNNIHSIIIVTEPFHSPRASLIADKLKIPHTVSPTLTSPCWNTWKFLSRYFLREPFAIIFYKITGKI